MISAAYCYERAGADGLAVHRIEGLLDSAQPDSEIHAKALAKAALLYSKRGSTGRAQMILGLIKERLDRRLPSSLRAYIVGVNAETFFRLADYRAAIRSARLSARIYSRLGNFDMAARMLSVAARYGLRTRKMSNSAALRCAQDAHNLMTPQTDLETRVRVLIPLAEALLTVGEWDEGRKVVLKAIEAANTPSLSTESAWAHRVFRQAEESQRNEAESGRGREKDRKQKARERRKLPEGAVSPGEEDGP
jgi:hypothetical protein